MNEYNAIIDRLKENNIPIKHSEYDEQAMGSWYVEIQSIPLYRIAHDGRDKTIVLEVNKNNEWNCLISDKTKSGKYAIEKLQEKLNDL